MEVESRLEKALEKMADARDGVETMFPAADEHEPASPDVLLLPQLLAGDFADGVLEFPVCAKSTLSISFRYAAGIVRLLLVDAVRDIEVPTDDMVDEDVLRAICAEVGGGGGAELASSAGGEGCLLCRGQGSRGGCWLGGTGLKTVSGVLHVSAEPDADPDPVPDAEPDADPDLESDPEDSSLFLRRDAVLVCPAASDVLLAAYSRAVLFDLEEELVPVPAVVVVKDGAERSDLPSSECPLS